MLGGDVHMNVAAQLRVQPNDEQSPVVASEIVTTSVTSRVSRFHCGTNQFPSLTF